jgi:hypothetical protein
MSEGQEWGKCWRRGKVHAGNHWSRRTCVEFQPVAQRTPEPAPSPKRDVQEHHIICEQHGETCGTAEYLMDQAAKAETCAEPAPSPTQVPVASQQMSRASESGLDAGLSKGPQEPAPSLPTPVLDANDELPWLIAAIRETANTYLTSRDKEMRGIAYTTLRAHALVLREDFNGTGEQVIANETAEPAPSEPPTGEYERGWRDCFAQCVQIVNEEIEKADTSGDISGIDLGRLSPVPAASGQRVKGAEPPVSASGIARAAAKLHDGTPTGDVCDEIAETIERVCEEPSEVDLRDAHIDVLEAELASLRQEMAGMRERVLEEAAAFVEGNFGDHHYVARQLRALAAQPSPSAGAGEGNGPVR